MAEFKRFSKADGKQFKVAERTSNGQMHIDYKRVDDLRRFLTPNGKIQSRKKSGLTAREQRMIAQAIKHPLHEPDAVHLGNAVSDYLSPYATGGRWLRGNLHAHTCCGHSMDLAESGHIYASLGYDFLAVTDHNKTHSPDQVASWQQQAAWSSCPVKRTATPITSSSLAYTSRTPAQARWRELRHRAPKRLSAAADSSSAAIHRNIPTARTTSAKPRTNSMPSEIYNGLREQRGNDETRNVKTLG